MEEAPLAHSAPSAAAEPQLYFEHVSAVRAGADTRGKNMICYAKDTAFGESLLTAIVDAAVFHDLGKLDPDSQKQLRQGRAAQLTWDHIDAGVAHLMSHRAFTAAWLVRAHHAPGLPSKALHFSDRQSLRLRGRRRPEDSPERHESQIARTNDNLTALVSLHETYIGPTALSPSKTLHGLPLRLALSCLVDADHSDTAHFDTGREPPLAPQPRWQERLAALDAYVASLDVNQSERNAYRRAFYEACRHSDINDQLVACEGPVGIGKTTAVTAFLLSRAIKTGARRLIIVAPYTAILTQSANDLRKALALQGEDPSAVVAEHHHRADFSTLSTRDLAAVWAAPIVLTTAVQFFETLAGCEPASLRKLHALPGSVIFLDEAHAALPTKLWPQNWRWVRSLAEDWGCSFVFASGSLARFWEVDDIVGDARAVLPELVPPALVPSLRQAEVRRVRYETLPRFPNVASLIQAVAAAPGPRLLILNTVQSAAVVAQRMQKEGHDVLHLSTALGPNDRDRIFADVKVRLKSQTAVDWTLIATSLVEAGVNISFRTPFRERFSAASLFQTGGRGNRNAEFPDGSIVYDFILDRGEGITSHPAAKLSGEILGKLFAEGALDGSIDTGSLVTGAMRRELRASGRNTLDELVKAEAACEYPKVAELGRVIDADTRLVVVDPILRQRLAARERLTSRDLLGGSVQIWSNRIDYFALEPIVGRPDVYWWPHDYDGMFLGYMEGALKLRDVASGKAIIL